MTDLQVGWLIFCIIDSVVIYPFMVFGIYWAVKYIRIYKYNECCKDRHSIAIDIASLIMIINENLISWMEYIGLNTTKYNNIKYGLDLITIFCIVITFIKYCQHIFHVYYSIELSKAVKNQQWRKLINNTDEDNYFIAYKQTWGNIRYTDKIAFIAIIIHSMCFVIPFSIDHFDKNNNWTYVLLLVIGVLNSIALIVPVFAIVMLYKQIIAFHDVFLIVKQFKLNSRFLCIGIILICISGSIQGIGSAKTIETPEYLAYIGEGGIVVAIQFMYMGFIWINTYWVLRSVIPLFKHGAVANAQNNDKDRFKNITVQRILNNEAAIDVFMTHLSDGMYVYYVSVPVYSI